MELKKSILSWRKTLIDIFGSPVDYIPDEVPINYVPIMELPENALLSSWETSIQRIGEWFSHRNFIIGLDHVTTPTVLEILYKIDGDLYHQSIMSVRDNGTYGMGVNYQELKTFFHALKNRDHLPLCIRFDWAKDLLKAAFKGDDKW